MKNGAKKMTGNAKIYSTHSDERKHVYLIENKEKLVRSLDTIMRTRPRDNASLLTLHFGDFDRLTSASFGGR